MSAKQTTYKLGTDVVSSEVIRDRKGRVIDDRYAAEAAADALQKVRGRGRPSLSETGESPLLRVRLSQDLNEAVSRAAERDGKSRSEWVREILDEASRRAG
jgi:predicted HicB family RNase H-like nuclease